MRGSLEMDGLISLKMENFDLSNVSIYESHEMGLQIVFSHTKFRYFWGMASPVWMIKFQEVLSSGDLRPVKKSGRGSMRGREVSWGDVELEVHLLLDVASYQIDQKKIGKFWKSEF